MEGVKELNIEGERVFVKKSKIFGWGFVSPGKIDGKTNWKNVLTGGSWFNLIKVGVLALLLIGAAYEYSTAVKIANECLARATIIILP